ncbi:MAG: hypothetical protein WC755_08545 [Candidatus Woesearchaeota archaeon]|jgi:hypothetical protein
MTNLQVGQIFLYKALKMSFKITDINLQKITAKHTITEEEIQINTSLFLNNLNKDFILQ